MWALFCKTLPLSSNALLGTNINHKGLQRTANEYAEERGDRSSTAASPKIWNGLPDYIRKENDFDKFKTDSLGRTILKRPIATCLELS